MIYVLLAMSILFVAIGFVVTERNAKYLLSGYNTMSEADRAKVNMSAYIPYFRKFHIFLGISFLTLGVAFTYLVGKNTGGIFLALYPILAYIYFALSSSKYSKGVSSKWRKASVLILVGTFIFVASLMGYGFKENALIFDTERILFEGMYGESLQVSEVRSIELVQELPNITLKTNGFASGAVSKGYFKTESGEVIKLMVNADRKPYILFTKSNGEKIYFVAKSKPSNEILEEMKSKLPGIVNLP